MADWYGTARSNYFKVQDEAEFRAWAEEHSLEVWEKTTDGQKRFAIIPDGSQFGGWEYCDPNWDPDDEIDDDDDEPDRIRVAKQLASHLQPGSVAILEECGSEKLRYLTGDAIAINSQGDMVTVSLTDITGKARSLGDDVMETY